MNKTQKLKKKKKKLLQPCNYKTLLERKAMRNLEGRDITLLYTQSLYTQSCGFSCSHVRM